MCVATEVRRNISHFYRLILQSAAHKASEIPKQVMQMLNHEPTAGPMEVSDWNRQGRGAGGATWVLQFLPGVGWRKVHSQNHVGVASFASAPQVGNKPSLW